MNMSTLSERASSMRVLLYSERLKENRHSAPARVPAWLTPVSSTETVRDLVTPWKVRSPVTSQVLSPVFLQAVLLKVIVGNSLAEMKPVLMWVSRFSARVSTLSASIVTETEFLAGSEWVRSKEPATLLKRP
jgi:hypothetical protein